MSYSTGATCTRHRFLHVRHTCRATETHQERLEVPHLLKKLNHAQQKYNVNDSELLTIYEAGKHFRHMLEARNFTFFTYDKPIAFAFQQKRNKCSPRQFNHLDFVAQFTTDIRHFS
jgi:hypothetical protein